MSVEIGNRLMQYRKKAGLSQEELADKLGVSRQAVSKWECGESSPDTDNLIALAKIYNVSLDELINVNPDEKKKEKKSGIHIKDNQGNTVDIDNFHVHVKDDEGSEVHVGSDGVEILDKGEKVHERIEEHIHLSTLEAIANSLTPLACLTAYLILGFTLPNGWSHYWILFLLIPLVPTFIEAIKRKRFCVFAYPVLATMVFLGLGMFMGLWHPMWILFLTIPYYYIIFGPIDQKIHHKRKVKIIKDVIDNE